MRAGFVAVAALLAIVLAPHAHLAHAQAAGSITYTPAKVPILQSTLVSLRYADASGAGIASSEIRLCGSSLNSQWPSAASTNGQPPATLTGSDVSNCTAVGVTEADGSTGIVVTPTSLSPIYVYIDRAYSGRVIPVTAGSLRLTVAPSEPVEGDDVVLTVTQPGGTSSAGSRVSATRDGILVLEATADGEGKVTLRGASAGSYVATASRTGFDNATATFQVAPAPESTYELSELTHPETAGPDEPFAVHVLVTNAGSAAATTTVVLLANDGPVATIPVTLAPSSVTRVSFDAVRLPSEGSYALVARAGTSQTGPSIVTIVAAPSRAANEPPALVILSPQQGQNVSGTVEIRWEASDPEGAPLTAVIARTNPDGIVMAPSSDPGRFALDLYGAEAGDFTIVITVSDGEMDVSEKVTFHVITQKAISLVSELPREPIVAGVKIPFEVRVDPIGSSVASVTYFLQNPEDSFVHYAGGYLSRDPRGIYAGTFQAPEEGRYVLVVEAEFGDGRKERMTSPEVVALYPHLDEYPDPDAASGVWGFLKGWPRALATGVGVGVAVGVLGLLVLRRRGT